MNRNLVETEATLITGAGDAADAPVASVSAEIGTVGQFSGVAGRRGVYPDFRKPFNPIGKALPHV